MQNFDRAELRNRARRTFTSRLCFILSFASMLVFCEISTWAQPAKPPKPTDKNSTKTKPTKDVKPVDDLKIDSETLPPKFQPPPKPLAIMDLEQPTVTKEELDKLKKDAYSQFSKVRTAVDLSDSGKKVIEGSIRYLLGQMAAISPSTMKEKPDELSKRKKNLLAEIATIGQPNSRPAAKSAMALFINTEVVKQIAELLKNNFYVRQQAVLILSEMDFAPAHVLLLEVLQAKDIRDDEVNGQPETIKVNAVMGLIRILRFTDISVRDRTVVANVIVNELMKKEAHWWRQSRMVEALRYCEIAGVDAGNNNTPFVVNALLEIVKDKERDHRVRAKACNALGRVPLPTSVKPDTVVATISAFALELSRLAEAEPKNPIWKGCFWDVYLAFHPNHTQKEKDQDAEKKRDGGLLTIIKAVATPAYNVIVPIVNDVVVNGKAPAAANVKNLSDFVQSLPPDKPTK